METTNTHDSHVHSVVAGIVMLAAIITTYSTYSAYQDDRIASDYEADQVAMEQTASAFTALRIHKAQLASTTATTTTATTTKETKKVELR